MDDKQKRSQQRKEQRDRKKRWKEDLDNFEVDRLARQCDEVVPRPSTSSSKWEDTPATNQETSVSSLSFHEDPNDRNQYVNINDEHDTKDSDNSDGENPSVPCGARSVENLIDYQNYDECQSCPGGLSSSSEDEESEEQRSAQNCDLSELVSLLDQIEEAEARPDSSLMKKLAVWTVENNIVHRHVDGLLQILRSEGHPDLPMTCKTLLQTPKKIKDFIKPVGAGTFWYQGIQRGLQPYLCEEHLQDDTLILDIFVDGASPYKSVKASVWPIVGHIVSSDPPSLFIIAVWCGPTKDPKDLEGYLEDFVNEAKQMMENGFLWNGRKLKFKIRRYIADAPGRAFLKNVVAHNSYGSCERCAIYGQWNGRVTFPAVAGAPSRTDATFLARIHASYHKGDSPLEKLGTGMVSQFPIDGMHLLYLGVMKKLLKVLCNEKKPSIHKLSDPKRDELSALLISYAPYCPSEFSRKPRTLDDYKLYKAHELRRILLYDGILLYSELPGALKNNFLLLHCSARILSDKTKKHFFSDADHLLKTFVKHASSTNLYGPAFLVYNVHHLEHFADECEEHGTIEDFSAFLNESFIGRLKDVLNTPGRTLTQIVARTLEQARLLQPRILKQAAAIEFHGLHTSGPVLDFIGQQYQKLFIKGVVLRPSLNDACCIMTSGEVVNIENFVKTRDGVMWVVGKPYHVMEDMYSYPIQSSVLGIYKVSRPLILKKWHVQNIAQKCMLLPILKNNIATNNFCCMPMLQHLVS